MVESQAAINFGLGTPKNWRKPSVLTDAALAILSHEPRELSGHALLDEDILAKVGVTKDLEPIAVSRGGGLIKLRAKHRSLPGLEFLVQVLCGGSDKAHLPSAPALNAPETIRHKRRSNQSST